MPGEIYRIKPFYDSRAKVDLPDGIYKVKNFHETQESVNTEADSSDPLVQLEQRQDSIFARLASLKQTLNELTTSYDVKKPSTVKSTVTMSTKPQLTTKQGSGVPLDCPLGNGIHDVVVCADPERPPLSLFILLELLKRQYKVLATSYVHSSVSKVDPRLCDLIKNGSQVVRGEHQVALSVIWKKVVNGPMLMISPTKQSVVEGEVNIARYINRLLSPTFDTDDIVAATTTDEWLDTIDNQIVNGNSKQKTAALKGLTNRLKKSEWIVGSELSLADIVMWSALNQSDQASGAPEHVQKWMKACANVPFFSSALTLV